MFLTAPIAGRLSRKLDPRVMMAIGLRRSSPSAPGSMTGLTKDWDFWELFVPQIFRGVALMLCMVPINNIALGTLPPDRLKNASGLFNLTRNLGGAVGLALINTVLNIGSTCISQRLHEQRELGPLDSRRDACEPYLKFGIARERCRPGGAQDLVQHGPPGSAGHVVRGRVLFADLPVPALACTIPFVRKPRAAVGGGGGH